jgi:3-oxosteroid 1-dehydrogenase
MTTDMAEHWGDGWDRVVDVLVVGCGAAGSSAAAMAAGNDVSVLVVEKAPSSGGTTAASRCQMWIPNNRFMRESGLVDEKVSALRYMARTAYPVQYDPASETLGIPEDRYRMIEAFYDVAAPTIDFFVDRGAIDIEPVDWPGYYSHLPEDTCAVGRTIQPVLPPDHVPGRDPSGGQTLVDGLMSFAIDHGAELALEHEVVHLIRNDAREVIGAEIRAGLATRLIGARKGVIFATGGFLHNARLVLDHLRGPIFGGAASPQATGDFIGIGTQLGARLGNMANAWWDQVVVELAVGNRATMGDVYAPFGDSMLMVNKYGHRALNEKAPYNERSQAHFVWDPFKVEYPNLLMFMIFDDPLIGSEVQSMFRWPVPRDHRPRRYVIAAETLSDLADEIEKRLIALAPHTGAVTLDSGFLDNLMSTIDRFNRYATEGHDPEFHRGETPIEKAWEGPQRRGAPTGSMYPLSSEGPYYCVILGPGALDTKGGPVTDHHARVLNVSLQPIPGLYGAGNCVASAAGQAYWGPGGTIGPAVTFGAIAARHAAGQPDRTALA